MVDSSEGLESRSVLPVDGMSVFFRMMAGTVGGAGGTLVLFMGILLGGSVIGSFTSDQTLASTPLAVFFLLTVQFFASLAACGLGSFLIGLTHVDKYVRIPQGLIQILIVNVVIFVLIIPVYFVVRSINPTLIFFVATLHFLFSSLTSAIVFEVMATEHKQILLGVYSVVISIFTGFLLLIAVYMLSGNGLTLFFSVPVVLWLSIGFIGGAVEYFYYQIYKRSGVDFLSSGQGYEQSVADEEEKKAVSELKQN